MKKIVIASDSYKGSISSAEFADCAASAIRKVFPDCEVAKVSVADGGEGTVEALTAAMNGRLVSCTVNDPLMQPVKATYGISGDGKTAFLEMAAASGLSLVPTDKKNPMLTSTFGTGELVKDAFLRGCRNFLIGIGGSATNDAGTGMLQALGFRFLDNRGEALGRGGRILEKICSIDKSNVLPGLEEAHFTIACDVNNPFSGENGAAHIYARQKGADDKMVARLDRGLKKFASVIKEQEGKDIDSIPGAGAAGGLGGGLLSFLNAELKPGIQMVLEAIKFQELIEGADLIITGEGKLDSQTAMGKTPAGIMEAAKKKGIPVIALAGWIEDIAALHKIGFLAALPVLPFPVSQEEAMKKEFTCTNIARSVEQQLRIIRHFRRKV